MGYEYDVFISYRRHKDVARWVETVLHPLLEGHLAGHCHDPRIFIDKQQIQTGARLSAEIEHKLSVSRCLIAVLCGRYNDSAWCRAEYHAMRLRGEAFHQELIIPIRWNDGDFWPEQARGMNGPFYQDFSGDTGRTRSGTWGNRACQDKLLAVMRRIRAVQDIAPAWSPDFPRFSMTDAGSSPTPTASLPILGAP